MDITLNKLLSKYPSWMKLRKIGDPVRGIFESLEVHLLNSERGNRRSYYNSFLNMSDVDTDSNYNMYYNPSGEFTDLNIISGYYDTMDATGEVDLIKLNEDETENYYPTRGFAIEKINLPLFGYIMGLCYLDDIVSGTLLVSYLEEATVYSLDDNYDIFESGVYCKAHADFYLNFDFLSGDLYFAELYHDPVSYSLEDIYDENASLSGLVIEGNRAYVHSEDLENLGRIMIHMNYNLCNFPYRIKMDQYRWQYFFESPQPDLLLANAVEFDGQIWTPYR